MRRWCRTGPPRNSPQLGKRTTAHPIRTAFNPIRPHDRSAVGARRSGCAVTNAGPRPYRAMRELKIMRSRRAGEAGVRGRVRLASLRTTLTGLDPGLDRLRLAMMATVSMVLAAAVMAGVQVLTGQPVTVVLFAVVLAMISNLVVNESDLGRRRVTTLLMFAPVGASIAGGTLLAPHRVVADVVFVVVMVIAVYVRRFGPRGFALGMAAFMSFFFTQFLQTTVDQLPWLLVGAATGIGSTLLPGDWSRAAPRWATAAGARCWPDCTALGRPRPPAPHRGR